jgi:hypothetical protein
MNTEQRSNHPRRTLEVDGVSKRKLATIGGRFRTIARGGA